MTAAAWFANERLSVKCSAALQAAYMGRRSAMALASRDDRGHREGLPPLEYIVGGCFALKMVRGGSGAAAFEFADEGE